MLTQNFVCTTMGELMNPAADLPETVAVMTFDDGFKDVVEYALPLLQRWRVPATVYCCSAPLLERTVLNVHRVHLLQAKLGLERFRQEFEALLLSRPPVALEPHTHPGLLGLYPYDDEPTRRFKRLLNFELPYRELDPVLRLLFERFIGAGRGDGARSSICQRPICGGARTRVSKSASTVTAIACSAA